MAICPKLTPTQALLLRAAARRADGRVIPPANLRGGARLKAMTGLMRREWIEAGDGGYVLTDAGYAVAGRKRPAPPEDIQSLDTPDALHLRKRIPVRPDTKLAALVVALRRPQGATSPQGTLATGWQPQSVRGGERRGRRAANGVEVTASRPGRAPDHAAEARAHARVGQKESRASGPASSFWIGGGDEEDRTPDLRIANATLSQLSYVPEKHAF